MFLSLLSFAYSIIALCQMQMDIRETDLKARDDIPFNYAVEYSIQDMFTQKIPFHIARITINR